MRKFVSIAALAAVVMMAPFVSAQTPATSSSAKPAKPAAASKSVATHTTNGTVKSVDATSLVITKAGSKPQDMTFALDPSTQKQGAVEVGSTVTVHYKTEGSTMTATAITAKPAKAEKTSAKK
jgi:hypothetical protein